jgi:hypothetical protein
MSKLRERFEEWWDSTGCYIDPDSSSVPWFYKRKELSMHAFDAGRKAALEPVRELVAEWKGALSDWQTDITDEKRRALLGCIRQLAKLLEE